MWQEIITYLLVGAAAIALFWRLFGRFFQQNARQISDKKDAPGSCPGACSGCSLYKHCSHSSTVTDHRLKITK